MEASAVLVTGGTGTLGQRVTKRLRASGREVRVLSRSGHAGTVRGDLLTGAGLDEAVRGVDAIVYCASSPARKTRQTDVGGTQRLLRAGRSVLKSPTSPTSPSSAWTAAHSPTTRSSLKPKGRSNAQACRGLSSGLPSFTSLSSGCSSLWRACRSCRFPEVSACSPSTSQRWPTAWSSLPFPSPLVGPQTWAARR